jgi:flagellin FlaB
MRQLKSDDRRFTGLEAAIVLIAFVVVAAVFSYVVYGYRFAEPASTNIQIGNVYGLATVPSSGINEIRFYISLAPNAPSIDLTQMKIVFSTPATSPVTLSHGTTASTSVFTSRLEGTENSVDAIDSKQLIAIDFLVANVSANTTMTFEMRPPVGVLSFNRTAPATITNTNIL